MDDTILLADLGGTADPSLSADLARCGFAVRTERDATGFASWLAGHRPFCVVVRIASHTVPEDARWAFGCDAPTVALCERLDEDLIVTCLELGADAAIARPSSRLALEARIRAAARRRRPSGRVPREVAAPGPQGASLTPTERRLFSALARRDGRTAPHDELEAEVWGAGQPGGRQNLRFYVRRLKQKLGHSHEQPAVINHRGVGYRLALGSVGQVGSGKERS